jgi:hypothetical protein
VCTVTLLCRNVAQKFDARKSSPIRISHYYSRLELNENVEENASETRVHLV